MSQLHDNEDSSLHPSNQHAFIPPKGSFKSKRRPRKDFGDSLSSLHYDDDVERELVRYGVFSQKENGQVEGYVLKPVEYTENFIALGPAKGRVNRPGPYHTGNTI